MIGAGRLVDTLGRLAAARHVLSDVGVSCAAHKNISVVKPHVFPIVPPRAPDAGSGDGS